jgi:WD40 repeat protein
MPQVQCVCPKCKTTLAIAAAPGSMPLVRCRACGTTFRVSVPKPAPAAVTPAPPSPPRKVAPKPAPRKAVARKPARRSPDRPRRDDEAPAPDRTKFLMLGVAAGVVLLLLLGIWLAVALVSGSDGQQVAQAPTSKSRPAADPGVGRPAPQPREDGPRRRPPVTDDDDAPPPPGELPKPPNPVPERPQPAPERPQPAPERPQPAPERPQPQPERPQPEPHKPPVAEPVPAADAPPALPAGERPYLVLDAGGHSDGPKGVAITPDGRKVVSASLDKTVRVWDVATGETLSVFHPPVGPGREGTLNAVAISPDGATVAVGGYPKGGRSSGGVPIFLISLADGRVERVLKGHPGVIDSLDFCPDGTRLASGAIDGTARVWDLRTGQTLLELTGHGERVCQARFSPDGKLVATTGTDGIVRIWSADHKGNPLVIRAHKGPAVAVAWSPDGKRLATAGDDSNICLWTAAGTLVSTVNYPPKVTPFLFTSLAFTPDGRELLYTAVQEYGKVGLLDAATLKPRLTFDKHDNTVMQGVVSRDGSLAVTCGGEADPVIIWRTRDGSVVHTLQGGGRAVLAVGWGADSKSLAWGNTNGPGALRNSRPVERTFRLDELEFGPAPAADVTRPLLASGEWAVAQADEFRVGVKRGGKAAFTVGCAHTDEIVTCGTLLPGSSYFALGGAYGVYGIDLRDPGHARIHAGHTSNVTAAAPSPDGRYFVTGAMDQTIRVWKPDRVEPLLSLFVAGTEWIAWTPEGYYAASAYGERLMGWQVNNGPDKLGTYYPAVQFRSSLYQPEVIRRLLAAGSLEKAIAQAAAANNGPAIAVQLDQVLPPTVAITTPTTGARADRETVEVKARARSSGKHPVTALRLLLNGRPYLGTKGLRPVERPKLGEVEGAWTVALPPGKHVLAVQAESAVSKGLSAPVEVVREGDGKQGLPSLYVVAVGVSAYPGKLRLNYAASDAEAIDRVFREKTAGVFAKVETRLVTDKDATRARILKELDWLASVMTVRDVAIFSFSGHGARDPAGNFYLVPIDANPRDPERTLLSGEELKKRLANVPGRMVALLDACHSGSAADGLRESRPDNLVRDLVTDDYGVVVMCSSQGREFSLERSDVKAGLFTHSVVEGLSGRADFNKDGLVFIHELDMYAALRVRQLSDGAQHPVTGRPPTIRSFPLAKP